MRQRIEDLGRITVMLKTILDEEIFLHTFRPKDAIEYFFSLDREQQETFLTNTAYGIADVRDHLGDVFDIATGQDYLNE